MVDTIRMCRFTDHGEYLGDFGMIEKWPSGLSQQLVQEPLLIGEIRFLCSDTERQYELSVASLGSQSDRGYLKAKSTNPSVRW
jgi:hypothetical protein